VHNPATGEVHLLNATSSRVWHMLDGRPWRERRGGLRKDGMDPRSVREALRALKQAKLVVRRRAD
jgi:hypothetical protein